MNSLIFFSLVLFTLTLADNSNQTEVVIKLNEKKFDQVVNSHERILVNFYASWCNHCQQLDPEYAKAAKTLKEMNVDVPLAIVDGNAEVFLAAKHNINGFPTIILYYRGRPVEYTGERTSQEIVSWVVRKSGPTYQLLNTVEEAKTFVKENPLAAIYMGETGSTSFTNFTLASLTFDDIAFAYSKNEEVREFIGAVPYENVTALYKPFDDLKNLFYGPHQESFVLKFFEDNRFPTVMKFDQKVAEKIFGKELETLFVVAEEANSKEAVATLKDAAIGLKGKLEMAYAFIEEEIGQELASLLKLERKDLPAARIIRFEGEDIRRYSPKQVGINTKNLLDFYTDYRTGNSILALKSEPVPQKNEGPVFRVVGETFKEVVLDSEESVLLLLEASWCSTCGKVAETLANISKSLPESVKVKMAVMDGMANEVEGLILGEFPILRLFVKGSKKNPVEFKGSYQESEIADFIDRTLKVDVPKKDL